MNAARTEARPGELLSSLDLGRKEGLVSELSKSPSTKHWSLGILQTWFHFFLREFPWRQVT